MGFIKSTDHLPIDHRPTDVVIMLKRLENSKIFDLRNKTQVGNFYLENL